MLKEIADIISNEVDDLSGTISGMTHASREEEIFITDELMKSFENVAKLSYGQALRDGKSSLDQLAQQNLWGT